MPSSLSHAMVAVALGSAIAPRELLRPFLLIGVVSAIVPDIDAIGRLFGGGDIQALGGHRGFTHSLTGAAATGVLVAAATRGTPRWDHQRWRLGITVAAAVALHGVLDMFTSVGARTSPVQLFSPFSSRGYVAPWHPIHGPFSELLLCVLPLLVITRLIWRTRNISWPRWRRDEIVGLDLVSSYAEEPDPSDRAAGAIRSGPE